MRIINKDSVLPNQLFRRLTAVLLAAVLLLGLVAPINVLRAYAAPEQRASKRSVSFYFLNKNRNGVAGVKVELFEEEEDPGEPVEPTDTSEPTEPSEPADTSEPTEPSEPSDTGEATLPSEPEEPAEAAEPEAPETADAPAQPVMSPETQAAPASSQETNPVKSIEPKLSDAYGRVKFQDLEPKVYRYVITVPEGYSDLGDAAQGEIDLENGGVDPLEFTVYALPLSVELQPEGNAVYGNSLVLKAVVTGMGNFTYTWSKDGVDLPYEKGNSLTLDPLTDEKKGEYCCTVSSDLTADDVEAVEDSYTLSEYQRATPVVSLNFNPPSDSTFQKNGVVITATVSHPRGNIQGIEKPTGEVVLTVSGQSLNEPKTFSVSLTNGSAATERVHLKSGTYQVEAQYVPGEDPNYDVGSVSEDYIIKPKTASVYDYITSEPEDSMYFDGTTSFRWYNIEHPFTIQPSAGSAYDKIRRSAESELLDILAVEDQTTAEGATIHFQLVDSASGENADYNFRYKLDNEAPVIYGMNFKAGHKHTHGYFDVKDNNKVKYVRLDFKKYLNTEQYQIVELTEDNYVNNRFDYRFANAGEHLDSWKYTIDRFVSVRAYDIAGNESEIYEKVVKRIDVNTSRDENTERTNEVAYHNSPVVFTICDYNGNPENDSIVVKLNDATAENLEWVYVEADEESNTEAHFQTVVTSPDAEGEYTLHIEAPEYIFTDNEIDDEQDAGNSNLGNTGTYSSLKHIIDKTDPIIYLVYDPVKPGDGLAAYPEGRTISAVVVEEHFSPERITVPEDGFRIVDITGAGISSEEVERLRGELAQLLSAPQNWTDEGDNIHRSETLHLDTEGIYSITLACTDMANNPGGHVVEDGFIIDSHGPQELTIRYDTSAVNLLLETLSLGFYNPEVQVTITARDLYSGVDHFDIDYYPQADSHSLNDEAPIHLTIPKEQISNVVTADGEIDPTSFTASFTMTADEYRQYRGSLSFTATDRAGLPSEKHNGDGIAVDKDGNELEVSSDYVVVLDTIAPVCTVSFPEPQQLRESEGKAVVEGGWKVHAEDNRTDYILYYNHNSQADIPVTLEILEANFDPQDENLVVKVNDERYQVAWERRDPEKAPNLWTGVVHLQADGYYRITADYTDRSGNQMKHYMSNQIVIDRVDPKVDRYEFAPATVDGDSGTEQFIEQLEYGFYFKTDFNVTVYASDPAPSSELNTLTYRLLRYQDGRLMEESSGVARIVNGQANVPVPAGFKGQIYAFVRDYADNASAEVTPQALVVDQSAPNIEIVTNNSTPYTDANGNRLFVETMSFTVTIRDTVSGLREIGWLQNAELHPTERAVTTIPNTGIRLGDSLGDGWVVTAMDRNLVTEVRRTFSYAADDNDVTLVVDAMDRSANRRSDIRSETVTVDKTAPVIAVNLTGGGHNNGMYYDAERTAAITVTERNFDAARINAVIRNSFGAVPDYSFTGGAGNVYTATVRFLQGNYQFEVNGTDRGNHPATVTYAGGNEREFVVDLTNPAVTTNFDEFENDAQNNFTHDKTVEIKITEHNFNVNDKTRTGLHIYQKKAGEALDRENLVDITDSVLKRSQWSSKGDDHFFNFTFTEEAVYMVTLAPLDLADRSGGQYSTVVFEIDKTQPVVFKRNGVKVEPDSTEFVDIYTRDRSGEPAPTVSFYDTHIDHIEYQLTTWIPVNIEDGEKREHPRMVFEERSGQIPGDTFTLENFTAEGIYTVTLVAVDIAGNRSERNVNTYVKLVEHTVLSYIDDSVYDEETGTKTGLFTFEDKELQPISLRPDMLQDLNVIVYAAAGSDPIVLIRDSNGDEQTIGERIATQENGYGMEAYTYLIPASRFVDLYQGDADTTLSLTVRNGDDGIDLGMIHIDNIVPTCKLPEDFHNLKWYFGNEPRSITLTDISEELDETQCAVYDKGAKLDFVYDSGERTITFTLNEGWHDVGIVLGDLAGNVNNIQEVTNIHVGLFWLWIGLALLALLIGLGVFLGIRHKHKKTQAIED